MVNTIMKFSDYYYLSESEPIKKLLSNWDALRKGNPMLDAGARLLGEIEKLEKGSEALIVGGTARDILLGKDIHDVDIATNVEIARISSHFKTADIGKSKDFGITLVHFDGFEFEVAHYRSDGKYTDSRRPDSVDLLSSFEGDSARRDFTINSLGLDKDGTVIDYQGGMEDIKNGLMRAVGVASKRFEEDALRIYRLVRFAAKLGFKIEPETKKAAIALIQLTDNLSKERIREELFKAAGSGKTLATYIEHLDEIGILNKELPEVYQMKSMRHDTKHHPESDNVLGHVLAGLWQSPTNIPLHNVAFLLHDIGKNSTHKEIDGRPTYHGHEGAGLDDIKSIAKRLKLSNDELQAILFSSENHMRFHKLMEMKKSKVISLVNNPNWEVLKSVGYMDAAARGPNTPYIDIFHKSVEWAEALAKSSSGAWPRTSRYASA